MHRLSRRLVQTVVLVRIASFLRVTMIRFMGQEPAYAILGGQATPEQVAVGVRRIGNVHGDDVYGVESFRDGLVDFERIWEQ